MDNTPNRRAEDKRAGGKLYWGEGGAIPVGSEAMGSVVAAPILSPEIVMHGLRITKDGITYNGQEVRDAGIVYAAMMDVLNGKPLPAPASGSAAAQEGRTLPQVESREFHELAMDYRGASFSGAHKAYQALVAHVGQLVAAAGSASPAAAGEQRTNQQAHVMPPFAAPAGQREALYTAAINCGHSITDGAVKLYANPKLPGNALSQLADRLDAEVTRRFRAQGGNTNQVSIEREVLAHAGVGASDKQTDLAKRLMEKAEQCSDQFNAITITKGDLIAICCETNRYYGGMLAWKQTAEKKDRDWQAERMGRVDDRCAARLAATSSDDVRNAARQDALEEAAAVAEAIEDKYRTSQSYKYPELRDDAETGARDCAEAIRALKSAAAQSVGDAEKGGV